jgi:formylglycine-generating enzyme required for sulfatase activity
MGEHAQTGETTLHTAEIAMFNRTMILIIVCLSAAGVQAESFGTGANQFRIDFVNITSDASSANGTVISSAPEGNSAYKTFVDPGQPYRMGTREISNTQWFKFVAQVGVPVTGSPAGAYDDEPYYDDPDLPTNCVSWYEAAQFVNWLNTSTGHHPAYNFVGEQGTGNYTFALWSTDEAAGGTNLFRHKDAFYFLPTEHEWVKAAYWNGSNIQFFATKQGEQVYVGDGTNGGWNYYDGGPIPTQGLWAVGSSSEELNGTHDMMGNALEMTEEPYYSTGYTPTIDRALRGGTNATNITSVYRDNLDPDTVGYSHGFRVASAIPEPASLSLLSLGGVVLLKRKRSRCNRT